MHLQDRDGVEKQPFATAFMLLEDNTNPNPFAPFSQDSPVSLPEYVCFTEMPPNAFHPGRVGLQQVSGLFYTRTLPVGQQRDRLAGNGGQTSLFPYIRPKSPFKL